MISCVKSVKQANRLIFDGSDDLVFNGDSFKLIGDIPDNFIDLTITSPPYCMGKDYESTTDVSDFITHHEKLLPEIARITKPGGSICWQVGYHVKNSTVYPLDYAVFAILSDIEDIVLRNRIVWTFGHGTHSQKRFSGRHETVLWFTKGNQNSFNLDAVRTPQKYPGKRHYKGPKKGQFSGNPLGKNPGDVWEIPNVKANHVEKTSHPCQFPVALVQRLVRGLSDPNGIVFDPFAGVGSTGVAAVIENRRFLGAEISREYAKIAVQRVSDARTGIEKYRPLDKPVHEPSENDAVAQRPPHFSGD